MKKILLLFAFIIIEVSLYAQTPQVFKYQTVVRDAAGAVYANRIVSFRISILRDNPSGISVYIETHNTTTNDFGIVNLNIGSGNVVSGSFVAIDWGMHEYFVKTEIDMDGGSDYQLMGSSQLLSVPYALFAGKSANAADDFDKDSTNELQTISEVGNIVTLSKNGGSFTDSDNQTLSKVGDSIKLVNGGSVKDNDNQSLSLIGSQLHISNGNSVTIAGTIDLDWDPTNELQNLSLNGDSLSISQGNYVLLPNNYDNDSTNELQALTKVGSTITLSNGGGSVTDSDNQNLSSTINGTQRTINISGGAGTTIDIADNDNDSINELQVLSYSNDTLTLSQGNYVLLPFSQIVPSGFCISSQNSTSPSGYTYSGNITQTYEGQWVSRTECNPPTGTYFCSATVNGKLYKIGAYYSGYLNDIQEYDPINNTWTNKTNMPTARAFATAAVVNNKIYVIGGENGSGPLKIVEEFDPANNSWQSKALMPTARQECKSVVVNNKIYVLGGGGTENEEFNPASNTWTIKAAIPAPVRIKFEVKVINNKIYLFGGRDISSNYLNTVYEYNPTNNIWTSKADLPTPRTDFTSSVLDNIIYVIGGRNSIQALNNVEAYDPASNIWTTKCAMPTARREISSVSLNNQIFVIGGYSITSSNLNIVESYIPANDEWLTRNSLINNFMINGTSVLLGNKIYTMSQNCYNHEAYTPPIIYFMHCKN